MFLTLPLGFPILFQQLLALLSQPLKPLRTAYVELVTSSVNVEWALRDVQTYVLLALVFILTITGCALIGGTPLAILYELRLMMNVWFLIDNGLQVLIGHGGLWRSRHLIVSLKVRVFIGLSNGLLLVEKCLRTDVIFFDGVLKVRGSAWFRFL